MALQKKQLIPNNLEKLNLDYGKLPPQALELEEAVLGAIMLEKHAVVSIIDMPDSLKLRKFSLISFKTGKGNAAGPGLKL